LIFLTLGAAVAWWFRSTVSEGKIAGLRERVAVLDERLKLAAEQVQQSKLDGEKLIAELQELHKRAQGKSVIQAKELEQAATSVLTDLARLIERNHDLEQTLDVYIPILAGKRSDNGIEFIPIMNKPPSP
jgi:DNA-binding PucR family transcriptional regulator